MLSSEYVEVIIIASTKKDGIHTAQGIYILVNCLKMVNTLPEQNDL